MPTIKEQCEKRIRELVPSVIHYPNPIGDNVYATGGSYTIINLQDVLLAIEKVGKQIRIDANGDIFEWEDESFLDGDWVWKAHYDLSKSFNNQEPNFYSFLLEIIK